MPTAPLIDDAELRQALALIPLPGNVYEIRVLEGRERPDGWAAQWCGWFEHGQEDAVVAELRRLRGGWHGVYLTPNPCDPLLLHKAANRLIKAKRGELTGDAQIRRRLWLLSDYDPVVWGAEGQIKGIPATDAERAHALARRDHVHAELQAWGLPAALVADSGNGGHLCWRVDLPAESHLPERFVKALSALYGDAPGKAGAWNRSATVEIDQSVFNPARIWKLYGTLACKGAGVGDRPHRMARIEDVPLGGCEVVGEAELQAWIEWAEARASTPTRSLSDRPAPAAIAERSPAPPSGAAFDALELARAAGLELSDGRRRADGATFFEVLSACPGCDRARKAWISVAESGAVGLGCRTQSCRFSDSNARPGDSWKAWRTDNDPSYRQDAEPREPAPDRAAYAERMAQPAVVDVAGLLGGHGTPTAPPPPIEPPQPAPTAPVQDNDGRRRINVVQDLKAVHDQVVDTLAADPRLYVSQGKIARIAGARMVQLGAGALDLACVGACRFVKYQRDKVTGEFVPIPDSLPIRVRGMLENLDEDGAGRFRVVEQVTRTPFFTADGQAVTAAGYCAPARTVLVDPPVLEDQPEPDGPACLEYLRELLGDFPFQGGVYGAELSSLVGAMLAPMVRPLIDGPMPMLLIEGNVPGLGKSKLGGMLRTLYGLEVEAGALPREEERIQALMLGILKKAEPVHVFDDVTHSVISATLNRAITGRTYSDRILGVTDTASYIIRQLWVMTLNNARASADMVRRVIRCRLLWDRPGRPEDRRDLRIRNFEAHIEANRVAILSRLHQLVREWLDAGRPTPDDLPVMGSFESFAQVIGGILRHAGDRAWLTNTAEAKEDMAIDDEWRPFVLTWAADPECGTTWNRPQRPTQLWALANRHGLLGSILGQGGNEAAQGARLASILKAKRDSVIGGYRIVGERDERTGQAAYRLQHVAEQATLPLVH